MHLMRVCHFRMEVAEVVDATSSARSRGHQPPLEASATPRSFEFILVAIDVGGRFGARLPTGSGLAGHRASGGAMLVSGRGCPVVAARANIAAQAP